MITLYKTRYFFHPPLFQTASSSDAGCQKIGARAGKAPRQLLHRHQTGALNGYYNIRSFETEISYKQSWKKKKKKVLAMEMIRMLLSLFFSQLNQLGCFLVWLEKHSIRGLPFFTRSLWRPIIIVNKMMPYFRLLD